jgi:hypothetical protein
MANNAGVNRMFGQAPSRAYMPLQVDALGNIRMGAPAGSAVVGISSASVVKVGAAVAQRVSVLVPGSAGAIYDTNTLASTVAARQVFVIPATAGVYTLEWPCATGVTVVPGAGQTLAITLA